MGDFNINLLDTDQKVEQFQTALHCLGLEQLITTPTRVTKLTSSLIDHAYTNVNSSKIHAGVIETDISDHFPIFVIFEHCTVTSNDTCRRRTTTRSFKNSEDKKLQEELSKARWDLVFRQEDVNKAYDMFYKLFQEICDKSAPIVTQRPTRNKNTAKTYG